MRFNARELSCLAHQPSDRFDKEGILGVKEKQDGLFRKGELYIERLFRLRGNLLFYFKTKEVSSEVLGVIVLERCVVQLDEDEDGLFSLIIVFEGDEKDMKLYSRVEVERDSWIGRIHIASYECIKIQLDSLREQLHARTGHDPIREREQAIAPAPCAAESNMALELGVALLCPELSAGTGGSFLEMSFACLGLPAETNGRFPDTFVSVQYLLAPSDVQWVNYAQTEIVEKCCSPFYLTAVGFSSAQFTNKATQVKVIVYDVKERMTNTMTQIGTVVFTMSDVLNSRDQPANMKINAPGSTPVGSLVVLAWLSDGEDLVPPRSSGGAADRTFRTSNGSTGNADVKTPLMRSLSVASQHRQQGIGQLSAQYANIITKTFRLRLKSSTSDQLIVHEYMGEGRLTYSLPRQLLKLLVQEETSKIEQLQDLGTLCDNTEMVRAKYAIAVEYRNMYAEAAGQLCPWTGTSFKPSAKKGHKEVEFAPTNLHLQRMFAFNTATGKGESYDVITVGAFMAGAQKFKHGGLRRLLSQLDLGSSVPAPEGGLGAAPVTRGRLAAVGEELSALARLRGAIDACCDQVCGAAVQGNAAAIKGAMLDLSDTTSRLVRLCGGPLVNGAVNSYSAVHRMSCADTPSRTSTRSASRLSAESRWKWSGTDFIKSPTDEPWEMTRLNTEAAHVCVRSKVEELVKDAPEAAVMWLNTLSPLIIKLKRCAEVMCARAKAGLTFVSVQECGQNMALVHSITYRRDVVFSQALTAATTGFLTKLLRCSGDKPFLDQILRIGILLEFEALLSCYSDDMAMIEDMVVGVGDLARVVFRVEKAATNGDFSKACPSVAGDRSAIFVTISIAEEVFNQLPAELVRNGVKVVPVFFNIGINEQATLAEKFGDVTLQETINFESYRALFDYYQKYVEWKRSRGDAPSIQSQSHDDLMRHLHLSVSQTKKSKNTDVLQQAACACARLNGVRFTSCKSAKDRSAMAVTLEQVEVLMRDQDLEPESFLHTLECMRSEGVRRENTLKNAGVRKYAFNSIQVLSLPKLYRPPSGTYGNYES